MRCGRLRRPSPRVALVAAAVVVLLRGALASTAGNPNDPQELYDPFREPRSTPTVGTVNFALYAGTPTFYTPDNLLDCTQETVLDANGTAIPVAAPVCRRCLGSTQRPSSGNCECMAPRSCYGLDDVITRDSTNGRLRNRLNDLLDCRDFVGENERVCLLDQPELYHAEFIRQGLESQSSFNPSTYVIGSLEQSAARSHFETGMDVQERGHPDCEEAIRRMACWVAYRRCNEYDEALPVCASVCANVKKACATNDDCEDGRVYQVVTAPSSTCTGGASTVRMHPMAWLAVAAVGVCLALFRHTHHREDEF